MIHLTELVGKSERTVKRIFKKYFAVSLYTYLKIHRLHLIRNHLMKIKDFSSTNITNIAMENGFISMGYFGSEYKFFLERYSWKHFNKRFKISELGRSWIDVFQSFFLSPSKMMGTKRPKEAL